VLIAALIAANLFGVVGVILAAPILATFQLVGSYVIRKMLDREPWQAGDDLPPPRPPRLWRRIRLWWQRRRSGKSPAAPAEAPRPNRSAKKG